MCGGGRLVCVRVCVCQPVNLIWVVFVFCITVCLFFLCFLFLDLLLSVCLLIYLSITLLHQPLPLDLTQNLALVPHASSPCLPSPLRTLLAARGDTRQLHGGALPRRPRSARAGGGLRVRGRLAGGHSSRHLPPWSPTPCSPDLCHPRRGYPSPGHSFNTPRPHGL